MEERDRAREMAYLAERVLRVECADCARLLAEDDACPRCQAPGGGTRAMNGRFGLKPPRACPVCAYGELSYRVEARMHVLFLNGSPARRVLDADPADAKDRGWHVLECRCENCEEVVAQAGSVACAMCGKSSLVRRKPA
jgi:hypothetical protein